LKLQKLETSNFKLETNNKIMKTRIIHAVAGTMILASLLLGIFVHQNWFYLTGFVGLNLLQSSFTNWCLLGNILDKFGVEDKQDKCGC
jgi:Protein of unknown function (DUF2892).